VVDALWRQAEVLGGFRGVLRDVRGDHLRVHRPGRGITLGLAVDGPHIDLSVKLLLTSGGVTNAPVWTPADQGVCIRLRAARRNCRVRQVTAQRVNVTS
jgi:hypothetical protein